MNNQEAYDLYLQKSHEAFARLDFENAKKYRDLAMKHRPSKGKNVSKIILK